VKQISSFQKSVLLVDDEKMALNAASLSLRSNGISNVMTLSDSRELLPLLSGQQVSVVVLDLQMPHISGLELLPRITQEYPHIPVILMTARDEISTVVDCMKAGAADYLVKPVDPNRLVSAVMKALELCEISNELSSLKQRLLSGGLEHPKVFEPMVTGNSKMMSLFQYTEVVAATRQPIMITGETGVGKEMMARAVHTLSGRRGELVPVNVAGLDDNIFTDTLFGHKKGAFTGADATREGLIVKAAGGTLFLDEIGDLSESSQIKLLRLMQEREFYPVGSDIVQKSDARIVLATNRDLPQLVAAGKFRNDLYYRLRAHQVHIPPLRERSDDIPLLLDHFLSAAAKVFNKSKLVPSPELVPMLSMYSFPGNIRELESMIFDAVARHGSGVLSLESFEHAMTVEHAALNGHEAVSGLDRLTSMFGQFPTIAQVEDFMIEEAMRLSRGNQGVASNMLGISRQTLNKRLLVKKDVASAENAESE
jgi:DNA-binding NtrC family response regulator